MDVINITIRNQKNILIAKRESALAVAEVLLSDLLPSCADSAIIKKEKITETNIRGM